MKAEVHPEHLFNFMDWYKWRVVYEAGDEFIQQYCKKYTQRETDSQFCDRKDITAIPAFSTAAINDVKNAIFQRMVDVVRREGPESYQKAIRGIDGGVNRMGATLDSFVGLEILPELLALGKVGVFVDRLPFDSYLLDAVKGKNPYLYIYRREDILNWSYDDSDKINEFQTLLLRDCIYEHDEQGYSTGEYYRYRRLWLENGRVHVETLDEDNRRLNDIKVLDIDRIPFVCFDIGKSLMKDIANHQIALMNMTSSDISYILQANFPFYTEQFEPVSDPQHIKKIDPDDPEGSAVAKDEEVKVGATVGRKYPKGMERPQFISPPTEPLKASMEKQEQLKREIRELVNLALSTMSSSAESKQEDQRGLESGLSFIGLVLQRGEQQIADLWAMFEDTKPATVSYPRIYKIKSEDEINKEVEQNKELLKILPSKTAKKEIAKQLAELSLGAKISREKFDTILKEIESAEDVVDDLESMQKDVELGVLSPEYYGSLRMFPEGDLEKAEEFHARRLARIAKYQSKDGTTGDPGSRGLSDLSSDPGAASKEKAESRDNTTKDTAKDRTRGNARS